MSMYRIIKDKNNPYVMVNKEFVNDRNLSWKAKGVLLYLLSKPDDWQVYEADIVEYAKDGKDSVKVAIKELMSSGYIVRGKRNRDSNGRLCSYDYSVFESPQIHHSGFSYVGKSAPNNNELINNNIKDIYIEFPFADHSFLNTYNYYFKQVFKKDHMRVTPSQLEDIMNWIHELESYDIYDADFNQQAYDHFRNLPKSNNGNILAFRQASKRYFEVDIMY